MYQHSLKVIYVTKTLLGTLIKQYDFDAVFHFAAMSHVDNSFNDPKNFTLNKRYGTHVLLDKFRELKPNVEFIHFSTDEVYGESIPLTYLSLKIQVF